MAVRVPQANRGRGLETAIEYANAQYQGKGIAVIQKVATPTKVLAGRRGDTKVIRQKSTVDFIGVWQGRALAFDAKATVAQGFTLSHLQDHQYEFLRSWVDCGGIAFLLLEHRNPFPPRGPVVRLVPWGPLDQFWRRRREGGRASITAEELAALPPVRPGRTVAIDYLAALEQWLSDDQARR